MYQRQVCFVCGGGGAELSLYSKPREKGPYFPFLDTHSPPRGARQPQADGLIDSCQVCYQFLNQQWESFEITKTPPIKRLYWLKRVDNGTFTGAEMRIQGEYAAQIMGLQYHPTSTGTLSPYEYSYPGKDSSEVESVAVKKSFTPEESTVPSKKAVSVVASPSKSSLPKSSATKIAPGDGDAALDLSVTTSGKQANTKSMDEKKINLDKVKTEKLPSRQESQVIVCYVCGQECPLSLGRFISAQKNSNDEPFFPFLEKMSPPSGCMPLTKHGLTKACSECRKTLSRQWRYYESNNFLEDQRMYHINDIPVFNLRREIDKLTMEERRNLNCLATESEQMTEVCYLCVQKFQRSYMRWIHTTKAPNDTDTFSMYFPIIRKLACPEGAIPMDMEGRVLGCRACYSYLQGQWQAYQGEDVPMEKRQFLMRPIRPPYDGEEKKKDAEFASKMSLDQKGIIVTDKEGSQRLLNINTSPSQSAVNRTDVPESPLISPYNQASGLLAIASGSFPFSSAAIPNSTMFQGSRLAQQLINQPLQIKKEPEESNISSSIDANIMKKQKSSGNENLADADMGKKNKSSVNENQPDRSDANKGKKQKSSVNENQADADIGKKQKSCENENQVSNYDVNKKSEAQFIASENSYCFLCGYDCREEIWHLQAQPGIMSPADVSSKKPPPPFFPFLVHRRQAVRARPISSDGHVKVCGVCYVNMTEQFYESQQTGIMPWEAKYTTESVRCILCLKMTQRINAVTMKLPKAELQELRKETSAQIFSNDEESKQPLMVLVCRICVEQQVKASTAVPSRKSLDISHDSDIDVEGVEDEVRTSMQLCMIFFILYTIE